MFIVKRQQSFVTSCRGVRRQVPLGETGKEAISLEYKLEQQSHVHPEVLTLILCRHLSIYLSILCQLVDVNGHAAARGTEF